MMDFRTTDHESTLLSDAIEHRSRRGMGRWFHSPDTRQIVRAPGLQDNQAYDNYPIFSDVDTGASTAGSSAMLGRMKLG